MPPAKAVRIVYIDNGKIDSCTCCGTHLAATGGVGTILFTDAQHYKGRNAALARLRRQSDRSSAHGSKHRFRACKAVFNLREELPAAIRKQADELASSKSELREKKPPSCLCRERQSAFNGGTHKRHRRGMLRYGRLNRQRFKAHGGRAL